MLALTTATIPAGAVEIGARVALPCGFVITVVDREIATGEVSIFYGEGFSRERIILPSLAPLALAA